MNDSRRTIESAIGGYSGDSAGATETVIAFLEKNEVVRLAAEDIVRLNRKHNAEFWVAKFLWDAFYGNGLPFGRARFPLDEALFSAADFTWVVEYLKEQM
jgi:hypothetical protein